MHHNKKLTDIHTHMDQYRSDEIASVLRRADEAGVRWIVSSGMDLSSSTSSIEIAAVHEQVLAAVGIHPWIVAENFPGDFDEKFPALCHKDETVAVGEVGLDFIDNVFTGTTYHDNEELCRAQEKAFRKQITLACDYALPLIVHGRGAYSRMISILKEEKAYRIGGVIHNFDEDEKTAGKLLDMGFLLSLGGSITYPAATELHDVVRHIPLDGILVETDSPYMPLYLQEADKNEPANIAKVARAMAELKKIDIEELIDKTYKNFKTLLNIED